MTAVLVEAGSGAQFLATLAAGIILGAGLVWAVTGIRHIDDCEAHRRLVDALQRIRIGVHAGWSAEHAAQEAGRALDRYDTERTTS